MIHPRTPATPVNPPPNETVTVREPIPSTSTIMQQDQESRNPSTPENNDQSVMPLVETSAPSPSRLSNYAVSTANLSEAIKGKKNELYRY